MSNTYREINDNEVEDVKAIKVKRIDKKHQKAKICDGAYKHGIIDEESGVYYETPKQKRECKKSFIRKKRHSNKNIAYDEEE